MRIATITNWAYGATVLLTMVSGTTLILASGAEERERAAVAQRATFHQATARLEEDLYRLTEQARLYSISGDPVHLIVYRREATDLSGIENRIRNLEDVGAQPSELDALKQALHWTSSLVDEQQAAIKAMQQGDDASARKIMFSAEYERELERVAHLVERFQYTLDQRTEALVAEATNASRLLRSVSEVMLAITALLFLFVLYFILKRRILRPVVRLSDVVTRLAAQDYAAEPPLYTQVDEIGDMAQAIRVFRENGLERQRLEQQRDADQAMRDLLSRMTQRLQGCDSAADLAQVVQLFAPEIVPGFAGRLYVHDEQCGHVVELSNWLSPRYSHPEFAPSACWALRRGQMHRPRGKVIDIACEHLDGSSDQNPICIPLIVQGETIGLLYLEQSADGDEPLPLVDVYVELLAENIGLALANQRLRDALRKMALTDPLTGLPNRHELETVLKMQLAQAERTNMPVSCLMLDVDHFKRFNDTHGHDAGDAVLRAVGSLLANAVRENGIAFRYGGEEFLLLMPGLDIERAHERAERIRQDILALEVDHHGARLGPISASFGLSTFPDHGRASALVATADAALLRAKEQGRNRVVVAALRHPTSAVA